MPGLPGSNWRAAHVRFPLMVVERRGIGMHVLERDLTAALAEMDGVRVS
jgi:hypothetical protein